MRQLPSQTSGASGGHRWAFLVNPVSGNGSGRAIKERIDALLPGMGIPEDRRTCRFTLPGSQLVEQVRTLSHEFDRIVVAGGDGTIGLAIQGIVRGNPADCALGVIPLGTGNDLARELRLLKAFRSGGLESLLETFLLDRTAPIDLWDVDGRATMVNYLSLGLDGKSTETFANRRSLGDTRWLLANKLRFAQSGLASLGHRLPDDFRMVLHNGGSARELALPRRRTVAILNISHYAGGLLRVSGTRPDDGILTVVCLPTMRSYGALLLRRILARGAIDQRVLPVWKAERVECAWSGDVGLQIDGEGREDLRESGRLVISCQSRIRALVGAPEVGP